MKATQHEINEFIAGHELALLWAAGVDHIDDTSEIDGYDPEVWENECKEFIEKNYSKLEERAQFTPWDYMGHDLALSRNGHGAGFFDRDLPHDDDLQSEAALVGEVYLFHPDAVE